MYFSLNKDLNCQGHWSYAKNVLIDKVDKKTPVNVVDHHTDHSLNFKSEKLWFMPGVKCGHAWPGNPRVTCSPALAGTWSLYMYFSMVCFSNNVFGLSFYNKFLL